MRPVSGNIRFVRSYTLASFEHDQNFERTPPDKDVRWMNVSLCVSMRFVRFSSVRHPLGTHVSYMYRSMSVRPELWNGQPQDM